MNGDFDTHKWFKNQYLNEEYQPLDTDGYIEAMNPELFDHIDEIVRIFS